MDGVLTYIPTYLPTYLQDVAKGETVVGIPARAIGANRSDRGLAVVVDTNAEAIGWVGR